MGGKIRQASFKPVPSSFHSLNFNWWRLLVLLSLLSGDWPHTEHLVVSRGSDPGALRASEQTALISPSSCHFCLGKSGLHSWILLLRLSLSNRCYDAQIFWFCKDFPQESVSNALWMNLVVHVVNYNIFSSESSAFHHEDLLPNAESLGG